MPRPAADVQKFKAAGAPAARQIDVHTHGFVLTATLDLADCW